MCKPRKSSRMKRYVIALACFLLLPGQAFAVSGAPIGTGTHVWGECGSGQIATPMDVANAATWTTTEINSQILLVGKALQSSLEKLNGSLQAGTKGQLEALREMLVQTKAAEERVRAQRTYGAASQSNGLCGGQEMAAGSQVGKKSEKQVARGIRERNQDLADGAFPDQRAVDAWHEELLKTEPKIDVQLLFPADGTIPSTDVKAAADLHQLLLNPFPTPAVDESRKDTTAGRDYQLRQRVKLARLLVPQEVLARLMAYSTPTTELGELASKMWADMGGSGAPEGLTADGRISQNALYALLVSSRFSNPNWYREIAQKNEVMIYRELAMMQAFQLELLNRMHMDLKMIAAMMATQQAKGLEDEHERLMRLDSARPNGK